MEIKDELRVATVQFNSDPRDKSLNLGNMKKFIEQASAQGCDIISFPEICITGYNFILYTEDKQELLDIAEFVPDGDSTVQIQKFAKEFNIVIESTSIEGIGEAKTVAATRT